MLISGPSSAKCRFSAGVTMPPSHAPQPMLLTTQAGRRAFSARQTWLRAALAAL
ncbi:MAG: hypothetical protein GY862_08290 [Gammaproteobacteria bacterium]|nr:hypothetical protein [Gammaproteobacteria bacterium]